LVGDSAQKAREARRASCPDASISGPTGARVENLMRPTAVSQQRVDIASDKRNGVPDESVVEKVEPAEETEEQREKWERFHHRSSVFQKDREKYLENLRKRQEAKELEGCTFKPAPRRSAARVNSSSMFDRARQMEVKKQERMAKIRQELFDKEMAQCSFQPKIVAIAPDRGFSDPGSRRPSASGGDRPSLSSRPSGIPQQGQYGSIRAMPRYGNRGAMAEDTSEGSEYWDGNDDLRYDEVSQGSGAQEDVYAEDVTILPTAGAKAPREALARPPLPPNYSDAPISAAEEEARQLKVMQRLQERRQLLEETLSPDKAPAAPFNFGGAAQFSAAIRQRSASVCEQEPHKDNMARRGSAPAAAVAEAVERMEGLLNGNYSDLSDLSDLEDSDPSDEEGEPDDFGDSAEAPVLGGKLRNANPRLSPTRGGC